MHVVIDAEHQPVLAALVGNLQLDVQGLVLGKDLVPAEIVGSLHGGVGAALGHHDGAFEAGSQVVEYSVDGVGMGRNQLP